MKKFASAIAALALALSPFVAQATQVTVQPAPTARVMVYAGQNPDTNETNLIPRFQRLADGTMLRDILSTLGTSGAWSNIAIRPGSGLNVTINPYPNTSQLGAVYQIGQNDVTALPPPPGQSPNQIPADSTNIIIQATQNVQSNPLGPLSAPSGAGNGIYYMVEAQLSSIDTQNQSMLFVSSSGITNYQNVNTQRQDIITYKLNPGGPGTADCSTTFPTPPAVDSGWIEIGLVCIPHALTQITTANIAMFLGTNFNGSSFAQLNFGGAYVTGGCQGTATNCGPSTLSTSQNSGCDLNNELVFVINNNANTNNGNHVLVADLAGDLGVCGSELHIFNQNSNSTAAKIIVNTSVDKGTATDETLYPANNTATLVTNSNCANATICQSAAEKDICAQSGAASTAMITPNGDSAMAVTSAPTSGTGVRVEFYNVSGSSISSPHTFNFTYTFF